jgi:hypothetical protein
MYGSVGLYLLTRVAGIEPSGSGVIIRIPHLSGRELASCRASLRGHSVAWRVRGGRMKVRVRVATHATLHVPTLVPQRVGPGSYTFDVPAALELPPLPLQTVSRFSEYYKRTAE